MGFTLSLLIYAVIQVIVVTYKEFYEYEVTTNTVSYIQIAQKYLNGDFRNAVNGAFGPLESWLLVPLLKLGLAPVLSVSILNFSAGVLLLIGIRSLSYRFEMSESLRNIVSFTAVPIVLQFTSMDHVADLLVTCALVYYLTFILSKDYPDRMYNGALSGAICAAGYFSKSYILPFFILHFVLSNFFYCFRFRDKRKNILRNALLGLVVFSLFTVPWIIALSDKYDKITVGNSGEYNYRVIGPEAKEPEGDWWAWSGWHLYTRMGQPVYDQGFFPPSNGTALNSWEDFSYLVPFMKAWSPFESIDNFKHQIKLVLRNTFYTVGILEGSFSLLSSAIIIGYILINVLPFNNQLLHKSGFYTLMVLVIYPIGYILLHPHERYLWVLCIMVLLMGAQLLHFLFQGDFFNKTRKNVLILFFVLSFAALPFKNVIGATNHDRAMYGSLSRQMMEFNKLQGSIASNDNFSETIKLFFYADVKLRYYGQAKKDISDHELTNELKKYDIDYYLVWYKDGDINNQAGFLSAYKEITNGSVTGLKIYSLKDSN
ncbi:MAG: hypothetical protein C4560_02400 [Nitrospiraceae bacterium]|nr:MAG: hypothetical protein C4560_02400 [Nitrospiraceae bacterium]